MRAALPYLAIALGLTMLAAGAYAVILSFGQPDQSATAAGELRDQGIVALMGGSLVLVGLMRLLVKRQPDG